MVNLFLTQSPAAAAAKNHGEVGGMNRGGGASALPVTGQSTDCRGGRRGELGWGKSCPFYIYASSPLIIDIPS